MPVTWFAGFENGSIKEFTNDPSANTSIESTLFYTGAYSAKIIQTNVDAAQSGTGFASSTLFTLGHHRFHITTPPASQSDYLILQTVTAVGAAILVVYLRITAAGVLSLVLNNNVTPVDIGSPFPVSQDTWYTIETKTVISATIGIVELKVNGMVVATGSSLNTGVANIDSVYWSVYRGAGVNSLVAQHFVDDLICGNTAYFVQGGCIARQGKAGTPTYDTFTKVGAATAALCWSDTPFSAATNCTSITSGGAQTMLTASFSVVQAGHGTEIVNTQDVIVSCKTALVAKVGVGSSQSIRRRIGGVDTDTAKTITTSDAYYEDAVFTATLDNLNTAEIGMLHGANVNLLTAEDLWIMLYFQAVQVSKQGLLLLGVWN